MNIAVVGQQKYDFQDLACVDMFLRFCDRQQLVLQVEPRGREDAALSFERDGQIVYFDIQVKGAEGEINTASLADCLFHFPERSDQYSLFERLLTETNLTVILVMSGRCNDEASRFLSVPAWSGEHLPAGKIRIKDAAALRAALQQCCIADTDDSTLSQQRKIRFSCYLANAANSTIRTALSRLLIMENVTSESLMQHCRMRLQSVYHIPNDQCSQAIVELIELVKKGKTEQDNIAGKALSLLQRYHPASLMPRNYVMQGHEAEWYQQLIERGVLLLSGPPRVGKSFAAAYLAAQFSSEGYDVSSASDIQQAERLLSDPTQAWRLVLLDDPLGSSGREVVDFQGLDRLAKLIGMLPRGRKLIVAQAQEHLLELSGRNNLAQVITSQLPWYDCSQFSTTFLSSLWQQLCKDHPVPELLATKVQQQLENSELSIEAGCLLHLAVNAAQLDGKTDSQSIIALARQDASSVGHAMAQSHGKHILQALAIGSSPRENMALKEMAYLLNDDSPLFATSDILATGFSFGGDDQATNSFPDQATNSFPDYPQPLVLTDEQSESVDYYERRRVIDNDHREHYYYTHPFYRSAAESLLTTITLRDRKTIMNYLERGMFCLSPRTSRASARMLRTVFARNSLPIVREELIQLAIRALDSSYPSTRDICYHFLVDHLAQMPDGFSDELPKWVRKVTFNSLESMQWHQGEAWLPMGKKLTIRQRWLWENSGQDARALADRLNQNADTPLSPEEAWQALSYFKGQRPLMSVLAIARLLSFDEALIRAEAIKIWLSVPHNDDPPVLARILNDNHPAVASAAFETAIFSWYGYSTGQQDTLLVGLENYASIPALALVLIEKLVLFGREEHTGSNPPWPVFASIMTRVLTTLPAGSLLRDARLVMSIETAARALPSVSMLPVVDSWVSYLERSVVKRPPSAWVLSIAPVLLSLTKDDPEYRNGLIQRLLALPGTGTRVKIMSDLTYEWTHLTESERTLFLDNLHQPCIDQQWLQAAVLTRSEVPGPLLENLVPGINFSDPDEVLNKLQPELLACALHVHIGEISELEASGTYNSQALVWPQIIELIAQQPGHPMYALAWRELIYCADDTQLAGLIAIPVNQKNTQIFELMLAKAGVDFLPLSWDALLNLPAHRELRSQRLQRLAQEANRIVDQWHYVRRWLGEQDIADFLLLLPEDKQLLELILSMSKVGNLSQDDELKAEVMKLLTALISQRPPKVSATCRSAINLLKEMGFTPDEYVLIEQMRIFLLDKKHADTHYSRSEIYNWQ